MSASCLKYCFVPLIFKAMSDELAQSSTHFNKRVFHAAPPPLIVIDIRECCMTFAQSTHRKEEEEEEGDGMGWKEKR